jgi:hypothetical protein
MQKLVVSVFWCVAALFGFHAFGKNFGELNWTKEVIDDA